VSTLLEFLQRFCHRNSLAFVLFDPDIEAAMADSRDLHVLIIGAGMLALLWI
jgi:hypothetical protein